MLRRWTALSTLDPRMYVPLVAVAGLLGCSSGSGSGSQAAHCGDLVVEQGEQCDGPTPPSCAEATLNQAPYGTAQCINCQLDVSGCSSSAPGAGGSNGQGGFSTTPNGGAVGTGAAPSTGSGGDGTGAGGYDTGSGGDGTGSGGTSTGSGGDATGSGGTSTGGPTPTALPTATSCPTFPTNATSGGTVQIPGASGRTMPVVIYMDPSAKSKPAPGGPLILYYHATFSNPAEVESGFGAANIAAVTSAGGVVAAFTETTCTGCTTTDDGVWFVEDLPIQDTVVACAIQQANIDTRHIHALGWSAGALHTMYVSLARSNYMASVISYSGGQPFGATDQDPSNKVASILTYGDSGSDVVVLDFNQNSHTYYSNYQPQGYYTMMCHHPGGHEVDPGVAPVSLQFFTAHPYKVSPEPYANGIPSGFPSYCSNTPD